MFFCRCEALATPQDDKDYVATRPTFRPLQILSPSTKRLGLPDSRNYVSTRPTFGQVPMLFPAVKHWGTLDDMGNVATKPALGDL